MKNNYLRYLSDKRFRDAVNQLTPSITELLVADEENAAHIEIEEAWLDAIYTKEDWCDVANEALQFAFQGVVMLDDEEAAEHLPGYEEWLRQHPSGIDLTKVKTVQ